MDKISQGFLSIFVLVAAAFQVQLWRQLRLDRAEHSADPPLGREQNAGYPLGLLFLGFLQALALDSMLRTVELKRYISISGTILILAVTSAISRVRTGRRG